MSKEIGKLAQRYAKALLKAVADEMGTSGTPTPAQQVAQALLGFSSIWERERELSNTIVNPMFPAPERLNALIELAKQAGVPEIGQRFLHVLFEHDRISTLPEVARAMVAEADQLAGVVEVEITVARGIDDEERERIEADLKQRIAGDLRFQWEVDRGLLGGMVVKYKGKVVDGSVSGRLARLEQKLMAY